MKHILFLMFDVKSVKDKILFLAPNTATTNALYAYISSTMDVNITRTRRRTQMDELVQVVTYAPNFVLV